MENGKLDWMSMIVDRLRDYPEGDVWSPGDEILCRTISAADAIADLIESLYRSQDDEVLVNIGYYDPEEDAKNCEQDYRTGWWFVNID